jgi:hypothetical protein
MEDAMNPWMCALLISIAGAIGGVVNALLSDNGFILPRRVREILCPGFLSNVLVGALAAFSSWASYGSGAGVELARNAAIGSERAQISLTFSALAGAFFVGVAGARWITNEADKRLLKESVTVAAEKRIPHEHCEEIVKKSARRVLEAVAQA